MDYFNLESLELLCIFVIIFYNLKNFTLMWEMFLILLVAFVSLSFTNDQARGDPLPQSDMIVAVEEASVDYVIDIENPMQVHFVCTCILCKQEGSSVAMECRHTENNVTVLPGTEKKHQASSYNLSDNLKYLTTDKMQPYSNLREWNYLYAGDLALRNVF